MTDIALATARAVLVLLRREAFEYSRPLSATIRELRDAEKDLSSALASAAEDPVAMLMAARTDYLAKLSRAVGKKVKNPDFLSDVSLILNELRAAGPNGCTVDDLVLCSGLRRSSVSSRVSELVAKGVAKYLSEKRKTRHGRASRVVVIGGKQDGSEG